MFQYKTIMQECPPAEDIPKYGFSFTEFATLERLPDEDTRLLGTHKHSSIYIHYKYFNNILTHFTADIVGCMVSASPMREFSTKNGHFRNVIVDLDNLRFNAFINSCSSNSRLTTDYWIHPRINYHFHLYAAEATNLGVCCGQNSRTSLFVTWMKTNRVHIFLFCYLRRPIETLVSFDFCA